MSHITAKDILSRYWDGRLPVNPAAIAKNLGIQMKYSQNSIDSGSIEIDANDDVVMKINPLDSIRRQRFTIAHEIAHHVLGHLSASGKTLFRDNTENFRINGTDPLEAEANRFAAELLMPAHIVEFLFNYEKVKNLEALAERFDVSTAAMKYRITNLGLV